MTTHHVLEIDRPVALDLVRASVEGLVAVYPELCSRIELGPRLRRFVVPPDRDRVHAAVEHDGDGSFDALERWMARPIDIERDYPFAVRVAPGSSGVAQSLTLSLHHSLTDGHGALVVFDALLELVRSRRPRVRAVPPASALPVSMRHPWSYALRRLAMLCRPAATLADRVDAPASDLGLAVLPIPYSTWRQLGTRARRCRVSRTTLLWHAAARAVNAMRASNGAPIRIIGPVDLRASLGVPEDALQNWLGTIEHDVDPAIDVRRLHLALRRGRADRRALATPLVLSTLSELLPPRAAAAVFRWIDSGRWPTTHTLLLTHLRPAHATCWPTDLEPRRLWCTSVLPRKPALGLTVTSAGDVVTIAASWHGTELHRDTVERWLAHWLRFLDEDDDAPER